MKPLQTATEADALPPIPAPARASALCPRITWTALHATGLSLLWLSGAWSPLPLLPISPLTLVVDTAALCTLCFYAAASLVDPGYLDQPPVPSKQPQVPPPPLATSYPAAAASPLLELPQCVHCRALQVARAKHCHDCGRCVRKLDHHCWWLGSCVGSGNHRLFLTYLTFEALLLSVTGGAAARRIAASDAVRASAPWPPIASGAALGCVIMCTVLGLLAFTLLIFQCGLISRGETTWEHLRRERINAAMQLPPDVRPYDRGPFENYVLFCCGGSGQHKLGGASVAPIAVAVPVGTAGAFADESQQPRREPRGPPYGL